MSAIVFLDTETTGLDPDDHIWEIAAIRREADGSEHEFHWFLHHDLRKVEHLPEWFRADHDARWDAAAAQDPLTVCEHMADEVFTDRPHVVGAVPNFDTERLARILRRFDLREGWHYHLIDIETYVAGYLRGKYGVAPQLPWDSSLLSLAVGVEPPEDRHTAMGDVRWIMRTWDAVHR